MAISFFLALKLSGAMTCTSNSSLRDIFINTIRKTQSWFSRCRPMLMVPVSGRQSLHCQLQRRLQTVNASVESDGRTPLDVFYSPSFTVQRRRLYTCTLQFLVSSFCYRFALLKKNVCTILCSLGCKRTPAPECQFQRRI